LKWPFLEEISLLIGKIAWLKIEVDPDLMPMKAIEISEI